MLLLLLLLLCCSRCYRCCFPGGGQGAVARRCKAVGPSLDARGGTPVACTWSSAKHENRCGVLVVFLFSVVLRQALCLFVLTIHQSGAGRWPCEVPPERHQIGQVHVIMSCVYPPLPPRRAPSFLVPPLHPAPLPRRGYLVSTAAAIVGQKIDLPLPGRRRRGDVLRGAWLLAPESAPPAFRLPVPCGEGGGGYMRMGSRAVTH